MPEKSYSKNGTVRARLADDTRARLHAINERHGTIDSIVVERLIEAFVTAVEEQDAVRWPITIMLAEKQLMVAEEKPKIARKEKPPDKGGRNRGAGPDADVRKPA